MAETRRLYIVVSIGLIIAALIVFILCVEISLDTLQKRGPFIGGMSLLF